jgi:hypothetical protein
VLDHVARGSEVRTDDWQGYFDIGRYRFAHVVTNVSASGDPAHVALPHVHLVASLVKCWILGTHQGAIGHAQLDYYLDEFTFRFNRCRVRHRGLCCTTACAKARSPPTRTPTSPHQQISRIAKPSPQSGSKADTQFAEKLGPAQQADRSKSTAMACAAYQPNIGHR